MEETADEICRRDLAFRQPTAPADTGDLAGGNPQVADPENPAANSELFPENLPDAADTENPDEADGGDAAVKFSSEAEFDGAVEAILFAASEPLRLETIAKTLGKGTRRDAVTAAIARLNEFYQQSRRAFTLVEIAGKFSLMSRAEFAPFIRALYGKAIAKAEKVSPAMMDTLAIIAYKQPVTRADIETVRGVGCGQLLRQLLERGLIKSVGKKMDVIGYPALYGTTEQFLREFGLGSLAEMPMLTELRQMKILDDNPDPDAVAAELFADTPDFPAPPRETDSHETAAREDENSASPDNDDDDDADDEDSDELDSDEDDDDDGDSDEFDDDDFDDDSDDDDDDDTDELDDDAEADDENLDEPEA